eukprot:4267825-Karenia_brevis.AAC.1
MCIRDSVGIVIDLENIQLAPKKSRRLRKDVPDGVQLPAAVESALVLASKATAPDPTLTNKKKKD